MDYNASKRTYGHMRPVKIQISLRIRAVWSESSLGAFGIAKIAKIFHANNENTDETAWMRSQIRSAHISECMFARVAAHIFLDYCFN